MSDNKRNLTRFFGVVAMLGVLCESSVGAELNVTTETAGSQDKLEEIVVSAQKRTESLQQVPISAQVITAQALAQTNVSTFSDLSQTTPGIHVGTGVGSAADIYIRGIGSGQNASFDQSVTTFIDDVNFARGRLSTAAFFDLDRIEVLKGPQTTFFGSNVIAGALNVITKKPDDSFDAWGRLLYGQFGTYAVEGAISGPITDTFGARLAATENGVHDGWITNINADNQHVPIIHNRGVRLTLDFHPDDFDATLKVEAGRHRTDGTFSDQPFQINNRCPPPPPLNAGYGDLGLCPIALAHGVPIGLDQNKVSQLPGQFQQLTTVSEQLTLNYKHWGQIFTSVTAFNKYQFDNAADGAWVPVYVITAQFPERYHQFSQELRMASEVGGTFEYVAGLYFQRDHLDWQQDFNLPFVGNFGNPLLDPYTPINWLSAFNQTEDIYSAFGSATWNATDKLKVSAGLRASAIEKFFESSTEYGQGTALYGGFVAMPLALQAIPGAAFGPPGSTGEISKRDAALMPSARVQYQLSQDSMAYFRFDKGFKAGGFNGAGGFGPPPNITYGPEHVKAYEVGIKTKWAQDTVLLNADVFRSDYTDLQVTATDYVPSINAYLSAVRNAAASRSEGSELEGQWLVNNDFRLGANITYLHSFYRSYPDATLTLVQSYCLGNPANATCVGLYPGGVGHTQSLAGQPTDFAPKWSGSVTAAYSFHLPGDYKLTTEVTPYFTSAYYLGGATDDPLAIQTGYMRLDARLAFEPAGGHWALELIGKNLTQRVIITANQVASEIQAKEEPRNIAAQFRYHFR